MKDRIPLYPGRVKMTPVAGQENTYDMVRADEPQQEGTPLNKNSLLKDSTAAALGLTEDAVPDDAFSKLSAASFITTVPKYTETTLGGLAVGTTIELNVAGSAKEFIVVHHGKPSGLYDDSCNGGTWLLMKDIYESRAWHSSAVNDYANSDIHSYLNSTFLGLLDSNIQSAIKQVKLPYRKGSGYGTTITSGASGLAAKIFLLSGAEVNWSSSNSSNIPNDGACLSYFSGCDTTDSKRIANLNGSATSWWLRSPSCRSDYGSKLALRVDFNGYWSDDHCSNSHGIRPALVLSDTIVVYVDSDGNVHDEQEYTEILTDALGVPFGDLVKIKTGSYVGTGTYGASNPNSLTFDDTPKLVIITANNNRVAFPYVWGAYGFYVQYADNTKINYVTINGNTMSWYSSSSDASYQQNASGTEYTYIAFC